MAILFHELACRLVPYAFYSRDIVRGITDQCEIIGDKFGSDAEALLCILDADSVLLDIGRSPSTRIQEPHSRLHQLLEVLVSGYYNYIYAGVDAPRYQCSDDIVGLISR